MLSLDELTMVDRNRYELTLKIKQDIYRYLNEKDYGNVGVTVKQNIIILNCNLDLPEDFISDFCRDFDLELILKKNIVIENLGSDEYPMGFTQYAKYLFKSSGGIF